jgi:hypothetical protein
MRAVCGRLEMRYRYSKDIVYNNFPWPNCTQYNATLDKTSTPNPFSNVEKGNDASSFMNSGTSTGGANNGDDCQAPLHIGEGQLRSSGVRSYLSGSATDLQRGARGEVSLLIEQTAQAILDARAKYPDCSLADLYDETVMPPELRKAHQENDKALMQAYGFNLKMTESECVAELFRMYEEMVEK